MRLSALAIGATILAFPSLANAWGFEGHEIIADVARAYMTPAAKVAVDQILAADTDSLTAHDMTSEAIWADRYRSIHRETSDWHFVDMQISHADLKSACFGFPPTGPLASTGPADECVVDKLEEFTQELSSPATPATERLLALKFVLHFVGDIHQPLHAADNDDKGGNCVLLTLGGARTVNLHAYWDTTVIQSMGSDPQVIADALIRQITPAQAAQWRGGEPKAWAMGSYEVAKAVAYQVGSPPGCGASRSPIPLPTGYVQAAQAAITTQLQKAGVRLAWVLNSAFGG